MPKSKIEDGKPARPIIKAEKVLKPRGKKSIIEEKANAGFKCEHCGKSFSNERTVLAHLCERKRRVFAREEKHVKLAFRLYSQFYAISYAGIKRTIEDFETSQFYIDFVKVGKYLLQINAIQPMQFVDWLIKGGVPLSKWTKPAAYETFVRELAKRETADAAVERNLLLMQHWATTSGEEWTDFFRKVEPTLAVLWIRSGRISPWVFYCCDSTADLLSRMTEEQLKLIEDALDPKFWEKKLTQHADDVSAIRAELAQVGL